MQGTARSGNGLRARTGVVDQGSEAAEMGSGGCGGTGSGLRRRRRHSRVRARTGASNRGAQGTDVVLETVQAGNVGRGEGCERNGMRTRMRMSQPPPLFIKLLGSRRIQDAEQPNFAITAKFLPTPFSIYKINKNLI